ncbi:hypothetical protein Y032_0089g2287 [Ancylostoma ceylanicum]|uniref:Uncharacterized protein n=1 Tax=Ancylostoma ceylanicum TaxID=53326 RepID=A0A016TN85_9BILA|nr:hypothetical protein Y032_0089g2287 [Ancylostoma ceylanicum]
MPETRYGKNKRIPVDKYVLLKKIDGLRDCTIASEPKRRMWREHAVISNHGREVRLPEKADGGFVLLIVCRSCINELQHRLIDVIAPSFAARQLVCCRKMFLKRSESV